MKTRLFVVLIVVIGLLAAMSSAAAAQAPSGDGRSGFAPELTGPNVEPEPPFDPEGARPWGNPVAGSTPQPSVAPDGIPIGQPGLSFRYDRTYGFSGTPYFEDSSHLNHPGAVTVNGTSIWISERFGSRAMKFTSGGAFVTQIGKAGLRDVYPHSLDEADDVAVDASGNIWIVDWGASHVLKFDSSLKYVSELGQGWNRGQDNIRFDYPAAIAFDATGRIYVSDGAQSGTPIAETIASRCSTRPGRI